MCAFLIDLMLVTAAGEIEVFVGVLGRSVKAPQAEQTGQVDAPA